MAAILTAAEMREVERAAIESGAVTGPELMERAGRGVVEAILGEWPDAAEGPQRAVVLCGPGNNGGDGFVVARLLAERGWSVAVLAYPLTDRTPADARANRERLPASVACTDFDEDATGIPFASETLDAIDEGAHDTVHLIDALFGIGLGRGADAAGWLSQERFGLCDDAPPATIRRIAVDVPTGLCADSGRPLETDKWKGPRAVLDADLTVTFAALKPGHLLADGPEACGKVVVADIGLSLPIRRNGVELVHQEWRASRTTHEVAKRTGHKYAHGHALLLSGGTGRGGAARLAARGALRVGAGLVTLAVPPAALQENAARLDAVMLRSVEDAEALREIMGDARLNAFAVGPGFGTGDRQSAMLHAMLGLLRAEWEENERASADHVRSPCPPRPPGDRVAHAIARLRRDRHVVLDADALTLLAKDDTLRAKLHPACVLTPHEGEFARLCPDIDAEWRAPATRGPAFSKLDAARGAAAALGCTVLLKGPDTVIASPDGKAAIHAAAYDRAAPWLATAGSGDVLAGMICGLLARGLAPFDAACTAAWLHVEAARSFGPGLIAEDLPEELPKVLRSLGL